LLKEKDENITNCSICNIEYHVDDECFFVDNVENGKIEVIPPTPLKDGYTFNGWYVGEEKWDFDNNSVETYFDENNKLILIASWI